MTLILSHAVLDALLKRHGIKPNDLAAIDKLFGGPDGYYWYHSLRHLCPKPQEKVWTSAKALGAELQAHEDATAAEDEVKPHVLAPAYLEAIARHLDVER